MAAELVMARLRIVPLLLALSFLLGCATATITSTRDVTVSGTALARPPLILVRDFELDAATVEEGSARHHFLLDSLIDRILRRPSCASEDPPACARQLTELIAETIVKNLNDAGLQARRISAAENLPAQGWLIRGLFTEVDEGNRLHRAVIGFGRGATQMQLVLGVDDLTKGTPEPLYEADVSAKSGSAPGAIVHISPVAIGVNFLIMKRDLERSAKTLADQVSTEIAKRAGALSGT